MKPRTTPIRKCDIDEFDILYNRERYRQEIAEGIYRLMLRQNVSREHLKELLGVSKGRVSQILSGDENLRADTVADIFLALGRVSHLAIGVDFEGVRVPVDELIDSTETIALEPILEGSTSGKEDESINFRSKGEQETQRATIPDRYYWSGSRPDGHCGRSGKVINALGRYDACDLSTGRTSGDLDLLHSLSGSSATL